MVGLEIGDWGLEIGDWGLENLAWHFSNEVFIWNNCLVAVSLPPLPPPLPLLLLLRFTINRAHLPRFRLLLR